MDTRPNRTLQQNRSLHKYLELLAEELDKEGHSLSEIVEKIDLAEIRPTKENLKVNVWHPIQQAMYGTTSTKDLTTAQVDRVYEAVNKFIGEQFHIHIPFPSRDFDEL